MNRSKLIIFLMLLLCMAGMRAQSVPQLSVSEIGIERGEAGLTIDFTIDPADVDIKPISELTVIPVILSADSLQSVDLPPVVIAGRTRWLIHERAKAADRPANLLRAGKSSPLRYHATVPFEEWMTHSIVNFTGVVTGCASCPVSDETVAVALLDYEPLPEPPVDYTQYYIHPATELSKVRHLEGQAYVDFPVNKIEIYPDYRNNAVELAKIIASIDTVKNDPDCTVSSVSLKGYASPEGSYANNSRLAQGRTRTLSDYVKARYDFPASVVTTSFEPEDWQGLRKWLEASSIENKDAILAVVDSDLAPDAKDLKIKQSFPKQYAILLKDVYPGLRHSDYRIEYVIRSFTDPEEIKRLVKTAPQKLSLEEFFIAANATEAGSEEYYEIFETAVRMYPTDETANMNAANSALSRGDFAQAARYLERAGSGDHAELLRGLLQEAQTAKDTRVNHNPVTYLSAS